MRLAVSLAGTDRGRSGIGAYARAVLTRMDAELGSNLVVLGSREDIDAYVDCLGAASRVEIGRSPRHPALDAAWHMASAGAHARRAGADVLLLLAANRRVAVHAGLPTVGVVHDLAQLRVRRKYDPLRMAYVRYGVVRALKGLDELVAVSSVTREDLVRAVGLDPARVAVVPNGVDLERFVPPSVQLDGVDRARSLLGLDRPYVLYPARLEHPGKNHLRLVRAFAASEIRHTHELVLSGADWGARDLIEQEVASFDIGSRVRLLGHVPHGLLAGLVAGADAVVMVGLWEGFGLPALEALACGRTVCAARTGALPEVVGPLAAMCDPHDERSIGAALERCIDDAELRRRTETEGPRWAAGYGWDRTAEGLLEACRRTAA